MAKKEKMNFSHSRFTQQAPSPMPPELQVAIDRMNALYRGSSKADSARVVAVDGKQTHTDSAGTKYVDNPQPVAESLESLNKKRAEKGLPPLQWQDKASLQVTVRPGFYPAEVSGRSASSRFSSSPAWEGGIAVVPVTDKKQPRSVTQKMIWDATQNPTYRVYHEGMHAFAAGGLDYGTEPLADVGAFLLKYRDGEKNVTTDTFAVAALHDLNSVTKNEAGAARESAHDSADVLLRLRHDMQKGGVHIENMNLDDIARLSKQYVEKSPDLKDSVEFERQQETNRYARALFTEKGPLPEPPKAMSVAGAVRLYRLAYLKENDFVDAKGKPPGKDNRLSQALVELEKKYPQTFADARKYMADEYGWEVKPYSLEVRKVASFDQTNPVPAEPMTPPVTTAPPKIS